MKKRARILCLLVSALVVFAMFPLQATTATDYGKVFDSLKASDVSYYNTPLPTGGKKQSQSQIADALFKINGKVPGKGSVRTTYVLTFSAYKKDIYSIHKYWVWDNWTDAVYTEHKMLAPEYKPTDCTLIKNGLTYEWDKGARSGYRYKDKADSRKTPKMSSFRKYKDARVLGQKCFVFSYKDKANKETVYVYVSRKTAQMVKSVRVEFNRPVARTTIVFVDKWGKKPSSFFKVPKGVTFKAK